MRRQLSTPNQKAFSFVRGKGSGAGREEGGKVGGKELSRKKKRKKGRGERGKRKRERASPQPCRAIVRLPASVGGSLLAAGVELLLRAFESFRRT